MAKALAIYLLLFIFLISTIYVESLKKFHLPAKALNSAAFVLIAFLFAKSSDALGSIFFPYAMSALMLCMLGDILLAAAPCEAEPRWFLSGVFTFILAHVAFYMGFVKLSTFSRTDFIFPLVFLAAICALSRIKTMKMGRLLPVVAAYCFFVALLCSKAVALFLTMGSYAGTLMAMLGAILFCLSDVILIFIYFSTKNIGLLKFVNLFIYYGGTLLLALSISSI
ncbi:hypothetical protein MASR2M70_08900 [Bacillota bacterium]